MAQGTKIEWCDDTCNPTWGCDGCELWGPTRKTCYAGRFTERYGDKGSFSQVRLRPGKVIETLRWPDLTGTERPDKPWLNGLPRTVFVGDMTDTFSRAVPRRYLFSEVVVPASQSPHVYFWLTKRPGRVERLHAIAESNGIAWPRNLWIITSITHPRVFERVKSLRMLAMRGIPVGLSCEPLLADISDSLRPVLQEVKNIPHWLRWVIIGGESGAGCIETESPWIGKVCNDVLALGKGRPALFVKQVGSKPVHITTGGVRVPMALRSSKGGDLLDIPEPLRHREMPTLERSECHGRSADTRSPTSSTRG